MDGKNYINFSFTFRFPFFSFIFLLIIGILSQFHLIFCDNNQTLPKSIKQLILENKLIEIEIYDNNFDDDTFNLIKELKEHIDINIYVE